MSETSDLKKPLSHFSDYFEEFRRNLIHVVIGFLVIFVGLVPFANKIYNAIALPLQAKLPANAHMIATDITSTFVAPIKLVFFVTLIILFPFIFYKLYVFLKHALYLKERKIFFFFFPSSIVLFYSGIALGYFFILPAVLGFFIGVSPDSVTPMTDIQQYLLFCIKFFFVLGLIFQVPLVIMITVYWGLVDIETIQKNRPYIFIFCFFIAMFVTPPDILSMAIGGTMIYLLFEIGLLFSRILSQSNYRN
ncbi:twin-arginine translocase subunit TatC [Acinetobacter sp. YH12239]|uniref:twin-arginine translocase subunit TatC n=1 Tax=Acinetobacter sp. YH12239 TaxID=2601166 RepID=UPI0015D37B19|nr:twin-arginine translocase subunit TatC [Acinetobacter sp. YH12239]